MDQRRQVLLQPNILLALKFSDLRVLELPGSTRFVAGICQHTLTGHSGPIFSLRWNKRGDLLLTGSVDKSAIVWNVKTGKFVQQFSFHSGEIRFSSGP